ncbi:hypothetical protein [Myroides sp. N17-2]|uniref:hypothetical protein n=1 Tax=Myroides sp. N17-2 TaxID=2030799 RepID=UPI000EFD2D9F|nr:hypothetical protein [Myroides sp. N17-2]
MRKTIRLFVLTNCILLYSCSVDDKEKSNEQNNYNLEIFKNTIEINTIVNANNSEFVPLMKLVNKNTLKKINETGMNLSVRNITDDPFFSRKMIEKSTNPIITPAQKGSIFPGAVLEGDAIKRQDFMLLDVPAYKPIVLSSNIKHNSNSSISKTVSKPSYSQTREYIVDITKKGEFQEFESFRFSQIFYSNYSEIKRLFGSNINTTQLFSRKRESEDSDFEKVDKQTALAVKFSQVAFSVYRDIQPVSDSPIVGNTQFEPIVVNSVQYGRMGIFTFETDYDMEFSKKTVEKIMNSVAYNKQVVLSTEELNLMETADIKIYLVGVNGYDSAKTINGLKEFYELVQNSKFDSKSFGVPISCTFVTANTMKLVEVEFDISYFVTPLYAVERVDNIQEYSHSSESFRRTNNYSIDFYLDREKTKRIRPHKDVMCEIDWSEIKDQVRLGVTKRILNESGTIRLTNDQFEINGKYIGQEIYSIQQLGRPSPNGGGGSKEDIHMKSYRLKDNDYFFKLR